MKIKNIMTNAWNIARTAVKKHGGKVKEYFAQALKMAWAIAKSPKGAMVANAEVQTMVSEETKFEKKPSATIQALNGVKELLQAKYPDADIKKPSYYKEGDIHSTMHQYALTSLMASGSILTLGVTVMYIPYGGTDYEFTVTVEKGGRQLKHDRVPVNKLDITTQGIRTILAEQFKLKL